MYLYNKNTFLLLNTILYTFSIIYVDNIYDIYTRLILYLYLNINNKDYKFDQLSIQIEPDLNPHSYSYEPYKVKLLYTDIINNNYIITFDDLCALLEPRLENSGYYHNVSGHPYPKNSHIKTINNLKQIIYKERLNKNRFEWIKAVIRAQKK